MRCPVCRAEVEQGPQCRRCRADLSLLFSLEAQRRSILAAALENLRQGQWHRAVELADAADGVRRDGDNQRVRGLAAVLQHDFARAWQIYRSVVQT
jgi:hypothetical protein